MFSTTKPRAWVQPGRGLKRDTANFSDKRNRTTPVNSIQAPRMGTTLRAFLCRYVADLQAFDENYGDRITRQMIDCGEILLIEGERLGGRL